MRILCLLTLVAIACSSCQQKVERDDTRLVQKIIKSKNKEFKKEGLTICSSGGSFEPDIKTIQLGYTTSSYQFDSIEAARTLVVPKISALVAPFNQTLALRPYLHNFPFEPKNIEFTVSFQDFLGRPLQPPYIAMVKTQGDKMMYFTWNKDKRAFVLTHTEDFIWALHHYKLGIIADSSQESK
jgi:uncharacterized protein YkuJ